MLTSPWYRIEDRKAFLEIVNCGDLLEFKRNGYKHWAVYAGRPVHFNRYLSSLSLESDVEYVVHRANPGDSDFMWFSGQSASMAKAHHGIGNVVVEELDSVWRDSEVRVNNSGDASFDVAELETIYDRAFAGFDTWRSRHAAGGDCEEYHLIFNNCEHFATYCRYGTKWSAQVVEGAAMTAIAGAGIAYLAYKIYNWLSPEEEHRGRPMNM